jgi:hypothetical protein
MRIPMRSTQRRVGKGALFALCPRGSAVPLHRVGTLRFAHPTRVFLQVAGNISDFILRSALFARVSKDGGTGRTRGHPSRRALKKRAPQDEVLISSQHLFY